MCIFTRPFIHVLLLLLISCITGEAHAREAIPGGMYKLDPRHTSVVFKISHFGFSYFTGRFDKAEGEYNFNAEDPTQSHLDVTLFTSGVDTNDDELDDTLRGPNWFDALQFPRATFHSTQIEIMGDNTLKVTGDFTLHGVTHTLKLDVMLVGAGTIPFEGTQVMGFSALGHFDRSDYGISNLEPMIGDEIKLEIDSEFDKEM